jgi:stage II sporulation protein GA (sporulation sigma-E factor processing peptidase)
MTIYIDVVLIENLIMNYIILLAVAVILKIKIIHIRILISSLIGAIYAIFAYTSSLEIYSTVILKILLSIIMIYIAFYPQNIKTMCKQVLIFYLTSFAFGGAAFSLLYFIRPQDILMKNGVLLGTYPLKTVMLSGIVGFIVVVIAFKIVKTKISKKDMFCNLSIKINNKEIKTKAMIDTGNLLKEPITNTPVVVVEHTLLYEIIPKEILNNLNNILGGDFSNVPDDIKDEYALKLKVIPFSSLGRQNGMLLGIKVDEIKLINDENINITNKVIMGIYNKSLTKRGEYRALVGIEMI